MPNLETLILGGGCFWCVEAIFKEIRGIHRVESGYAGGRSFPTSYKEVCTGTTGHAEVIKIDFDPELVSRTDLLRVFFTVHDPTTPNRQGGDVGTQYRSVIFFADDSQKTHAQSVIDEVTREQLWEAPIVTTLEPLNGYQAAEDYHQDYYKKFEEAGPLQRMTMNSGYCSAVVGPKVTKARKLLKEKLLAKV